VNGGLKVHKLRRWITRYAAPAALVAALAVAAWWMHIGAYPIAAMALGGLVGGVELAARYRHAPVRAATSWSGGFYILLNVAASWAAFSLLDAFSVFDLTKPDQQIKAMLTAGFGSLVFMRSSLFKVRVGDSDVGIGPAAVLDTLLLIADRGVDRREAVARAQDVSELVAHVNDPRKVAAMLTKYSLALMQNVDEKTSQDLADAVGKILGDADIPDTIKIDIVALRLGVVVGPDVLEAAVSALGDRLATGLPALPDLPPPPAAAPPWGYAQGSPVGGSASAGSSTPPASAPSPSGPQPLVRTPEDLKAEIDTAKARVEASRQAAASPTEGPRHSD